MASVPRPTSSAAAVVAASAASPPAPAEVVAVSSDTVPQEKIDFVLLDALVVLKIIKHCKENLPEVVTGQLLGLDVETTLEVSNSFPFANTDDEEDTDAALEYQLDMMKCLREVNVDNNTVGWYQSTYLGSFLTDSMIEAQFNYQSTIKKCVVIIYDPLKTTQGTVALQAFRLTQRFMDLYRKKVFTKDR